MSIRSDGLHATSALVVEELTYWLHIDDEEFLEDWVQSIGTIRYVPSSSLSRKITKLIFSSEFLFSAYKCLAEIG